MVPWASFARSVPDGVEINHFMELGCGVFAVEACDATLTVSGGASDEEREHAIARAGEEQYWADLRRSASRAKAALKNPRAARVPDLLRGFKRTPRRIQ